MPESLLGTFFQLLSWSNKRSHLLKELKKITSAQRTLPSYVLKPTQLKPKTLRQEHIPFLLFKLCIKYLYKQWGRDCNPIKYPYRWAVDSLFHSSFLSLYPNEHSIILEKTSAEEMERTLLFPRTPYNLVVRVLFWA